MTKKKSTAKRGTPKLPNTMAHKRAQKMAQDFIEQMQRAVDEQTAKDFGLPPQDKKQAEKFRKDVTQSIVVANQNKKRSKK